MITQIDGGVCAAKGFFANAIHVGVKTPSPDSIPIVPTESLQAKRDLAIIFCEKSCNTAAVYTTNKVKAAPILVTQEHLADGKAQAVIVNSGNANACTPNGRKIAEGMCRLAADALGIVSDEVVVASTGVIGKPMSIENWELVVYHLAEKMQKGGSAAVAEAIMTTDTFPKECAVTFTLGGQQCTIGAVAKGSGMINPNMATMLCFITTDVNISQKLLVKALHDVNADTFNMVCVDGDTSTNDMVCIMASGLAGNEEIVDAKSEDYKNFAFLLYSVMRSLARDVAKDGEGATKLIECKVAGAPDVVIARKIAKSVVSSNLVKAALGAADANWGRILCAIGYTEGEFDIDDIKVAISSDKGTVVVCENGSAVQFSEEEATEVLSEPEITLNIDLKSGDASATAYGCDLTEKYVQINANYRT